MIEADAKCLNPKPGQEPQSTGKFPLILVVVLMTIFADPNAEDILWDLECVLQFLEIWKLWGSKFAWVQNIDPCRKWWLKFRDTEQGWWEDDNAGKHSN